MVMIPLMRGHTVICDRYVLDLMVEGMADLKDQPGPTGLVFQVCHPFHHQVQNVTITDYRVPAHQRNHDHRSGLDEIVNLCQSSPEKSDRSLLPPPRPDETDAT